MYDRNFALFCTFLRRVPDKVVRQRNAGGDGVRTAFDVDRRTTVCSSSASAMVRASR